jgi:hypothetical protein
MQANKLIGFNPRDWKRFVEVPYFTNKWRYLGLKDHDLHALQLTLLANPRVGAVMKGSGGLRKCRFAPRTAGKGKSGAFRVGCVCFEQFDVICLLAVFAKKDEANLSRAEQNALRKAIERLYDWVATERSGSKSRER